MPYCGHHSCLSLKLQGQNPVVSCHCLAGEMVVEVCPASTSLGAVHQQRPKLAIGGAEATRGPGVNWESKEVKAKGMLTELGDPNRTLIQWGFFLSKF